MTLLAVQSLSISLPGTAARRPLVDGISFSIAPGEIVGVLGESGCGKSLTALAIMGLLPPAMKAGGSIMLKGEELLGAPEADLCRIRGDRIGMIFQEPMTALNPVQTIGQQVAEPLVVHRGLRGKEARAEALRLLERIRLPEARRRLDAYPHQLSGGQRQRVVIAMALACGPDVLVADEPTTALDTTVQRQILDLLLELADESRAGLLFITHDIGVMAETTDRIVVMYAGRVIEAGATGSVLGSPSHPYTRGLLAANPQRALTGGGRLETIPGAVPSPGAGADRCLFVERCPVSLPVCHDVVPPTVSTGPHRGAACHLLTGMGGAP